MTPSRGNSWEQHEGILWDFTDELLAMIACTDYSFADYCIETANEVLGDDADDRALIDSIQDFLEIWADWYVTQRRLARAKAPGVHSIGPVEDA